MSARPFVKETKIRFADVDPAGIVFYPRYFEMFNEVVEDWFAEGLGTPFSKLINKMGYGAPLAHIEVDFTSPSELDDVVRFTLGVERVGRSSIHLRIVGASGGQERLTARLVIVIMTIADGRPAEIPAELRAAIEPFALAPAGGG